MSDSKVKRHKVIYGKYFKNKARFLFLLITIIIIGVAIGNLSPYLFGKIIDFIISNDLKSLKYYLILYIITMFVSAIMNLLENRISQTISFLISNNIKKDIFEKFMHLVKSNFSILKKEQNINTIMQLIKTLINCISIYSLTYLFAIFITTGKLTVGNMVSFNTYASRLFDAISKIMTLNITSNKVKVSIERLEKIENESSENIMNHTNVGLHVTHKVSSVINSDKIFVINNGKVEIVGKHDELMKNNRLYQDLFDFIK